MRNADFRSCQKEAIPPNPHEHRLTPGIDTGNSISRLDVVATKRPPWRKLSRKVIAVSVAGEGRYISVFARLEDKHPHAGNVATNHERRYALVDRSIDLAYDLFVITHGKETPMQGVLFDRPDV